MNTLQTDLGLLGLESANHKHPYWIKVGLSKILEQGITLLWRERRKTMERSGRESDSSPVLLRLQICLCCQLKAGKAIARREPGTQNVSMDEDPTNK